MENLVELLIFIIVIIASGAGSLLQKRQENKNEPDPSQDWTPMPPAAPKPPGSPPVPPLTPVAGEYRQTRTSVWGEPAPASQTPASAETREKMRRRLEAQTRKKHRRPDAVRPSAAEGAPQPTPFGGSTLEDVMRDLFNVEIQREETPPPPPEPVRPIPAVRKVERKAEPVRAIPRSAKPAASAPHPFFRRLAHETEQNPLRAAVICAEILQRPRPLRPAMISSDGLRTAQD